MNKYLGTAVIAAAIGFASPAFAQNATHDAPGAFDGVSVAVIAGVNALSIQQDDAADSTRGFLYGVSAGYDHDVGHVVLGIQAEYSDSSTSYDIDDLITVGDEFNSAAGRDLYAGVRVGMHASANSLVYIGGGYVNSKITSHYDDGIDAIELSENKGGFRVSGGGELAFAKSAFARLELRYQDLGAYTVFGQDTGLARTNTQIIAGLGLRF